MPIIPKKTVNCPRCGHHEIEHISLYPTPHCRHEEVGPATMGSDGWYRQGPLLECDCNLSVEDIYINLKMRGQSG